MLESNVFSRTAEQSDTVGAGTYNLIIGLVLCWGFFVNWQIVVNINPIDLMAIPFWMFMLGYFGSCMLGVYLFSSSDKPLVSFIGYNFVVVPFGLIINMIVSRYDPYLVMDAIKVTGGVTVIMMSLGVLFPRFFQRVSGALFASLIAVIIIEVVQVYVMGIHHDWIDWAVAAIFCGYIGYDWGRANQIPKTVDNAIDSAAALYMDIINLFLRILRIMGRQK